MGGFSDNYEGGYWDLNGLPTAMKQENKYNSINTEKSYEVDSDTTHDYLAVRLSLTHLLKSNEQYIRGRLCHNHDQDTPLKLIYNQENKNLELYYRETFIGSIQKKFEQEGIDNSSMVNDFCLENGVLKKVEALWNGEDFYLKKKRV